MRIKRLTIKNFGKISNKTMTLSPGLNVLYGENESGKTTIHTFIKSMLYGISRQRGKAARNDAYTTYEPWENPSVYGGTLWMESGGRNFRLSRNFHKMNPASELLCEDDGELLDVEQGDLEGILGEVSEAVYDNTVSVAQLKSVTGQDLVRELQNYMAGYQGAGDSSIDLGRAMQMLKMSRKGFQVQEDRGRKERQQEQEKLSGHMAYLAREMEELQEKQSLVEAREETLHMKPGSSDGEKLLEDRIQGIRKKKIMLGVGMFLAVLLGAFGQILFLRYQTGLVLRLLVLAVSTAVFTGGAFYQRKLSKEWKKRKKMKARWISRQEKLKWNRENLQETYEEKKTDYTNLQAEYREYEERSYLPTLEGTEVEAINLAMETIEGLSGNIHNQVGDGLKKRTSQILSEITGGKYTEVLMDQNLHMTVNTQERVIPLERLSRGTLEQIYFALRMAAGELLCGDEAFPVILDDVFGMYDEERLAAVLKWMYQEKKQIIISTCHKREMEILEKEGIPYQKLLLSEN